MLHAGHRIELDYHPGREGSPGYDGESWNHPEPPSCLARALNARGEIVATGRADSLGEALPRLSALPVTKPGADGD